MEKQRNIAFDLMKGITILLMMWCHLANEHNQIVYSFHMPLFFVLAGYYAKTNTPPQKWHSQSRKNAKRLLLPFVVTMLMLSLWGIVQAIMKDDWTMALRHPLSMVWASADTFYTDKFGLVYAGPMWFLIALFGIREVFYYGAGWIISHTKRWADEIIVVVCVLISLFVALVRPYLPNMPFCIWQGLGAIEFYAIGWYAHRHKISWWLKVICIVCWPMAIMWGGLELESCVYVCYPLVVLGACGAVFVIYQLCEWISKGIKKLLPDAYSKFKMPMQWLGLNTLAILCMHTFDLHSGMIYSVLIRLPFEVSAWMLVGVRMLLAIGLAWLITKTPGLRWVYK